MFEVLEWRGEGRERRVEFRFEGGKDFLLEIRKNFFVNGILLMSVFKDSKFFY